MGYPKKGEQRNTGRTYFKKGMIAWNKGLRGEKSHLFGKHLSENTKKKIGLANAIALKGKKFPREVCKKISESNKGKHYHWLGKHHSKETKEKMRLVHKGKYRGSNNNFWKGGLSSWIDLLRNSFEYKEWRIKVFERDKYTCCECHKVGGKLEAHHIERFVDILRRNNIDCLEKALICKDIWEIDNGLTLCKECHRLTDNFANRINRYGRRI